MSDTSTRQPRPGLHTARTLVGVLAGVLLASALALVARGPTLPSPMPRSSAPCRRAPSPWSSSWPPPAPSRLGAGPHLRGPHVDHLRATAPRQGRRLPRPRRDRVGEPVAPRAPRRQDGGAAGPVAARRDGGGRRRAGVDGRARPPATRPGDRAGAVHHHGRRRARGAGRGPGRHRRGHARRHRRPGAGRQQRHPPLLPRQRRRSPGGRRRGGLGHHHRRARPQVACDPRDRRPCNRRRGIAALTRHLDRRSDGRAGRIAPGLHLRGTDHMTHRPAPDPRRRGRSAAAWLAAVAATIGVAVGLMAGPPGPPAAAPCRQRNLTGQATHRAGAAAVHYIVRVTWEDDGHPAAEATVTAAAVGGNGTTLTPVTLASADDDGRYAGVVEYPEAGSWTVRFTSIDPTGTAERSEEIAAPATTGPDDDSDTAGDGDDAADADEAGGFAPADDGTGSSDETAAGDDDDGLPVWLVLVALAVVIGGAATALGIVRRYRTEAEAESAQFDALEAGRPANAPATTRSESGPQPGAGDGRDPTTPAEPRP